MIARPLPPIAGAFRTIMFVCIAPISLEFNSLAYALFLAAVTVLYFCPLAVKSARRQNVLVLCVSYLFYGAWDWRFLSLIILTTLSTYYTARLTEKRRAAIWPVCNIVMNLSVLALFKYFGFFSENIRWLMRMLGWEMDWFTLDVLLPVGISFYTFQAIGYTVDVWRGDIKPARSLILFATFIAYFPQLVAGPIERASALLPQLDRVNRWQWRNGVAGLRLILWGLFKKVAVADPCGSVVDGYYGQCLSGEAEPLRCYLAAMLFALQLYCDFSGYCDIAAGSARMLGVDLTQNFNRPYIARNFVEFWRRWHISLTRWFTDYLYIPLGGSQKGRTRHFLNVMAVFLVSGLWHGAGWGFVLWGAACGLFYWLQKRLGYDSFRGGPEPGIWDFPRIFATFSLFAVLLVPFRLDGDISAAVKLCWRYIVPLSMMAVIGVNMVFRCVRFLMGRRPHCGRCQVNLPHMFLPAVAGVVFLAVAYVFPAVAWFHLYLLLALVMYCFEWETRTLRWESCPFPLPASRVARMALYMSLYLLILTYGLLRLPPVSDGTTFLYFQF